MALTTQPKEVLSSPFIFAPFFQCPTYAPFIVIFEANFVTHFASRGTAKCLYQPSMYPSILYIVTPVVHVFTRICLTRFMAYRQVMTMLFRSFGIRTSSLRPLRYGVFYRQDRGKWA